MNNSNFYKPGKFIFAFSILCIGIVHLVFKGFPIGFEPVSTILLFKTTLAYFFGALMIISAILIITKKFSYQGSILASSLFIIVTLTMHLPKVLGNMTNGSLITGLFEASAILSGAMMLVTLNKNAKKNIANIARIIFAFSLIVFGVLHLVYAKFVETLIPDWLPLHSLLNYLVILGFLASALSFLIQKFTNLAGTLLSAMFLIWFIILHLPRAIASPVVEPEWTSAFICLAMSGIALLAISVSTKKAAQY